MTAQRSSSPVQAHRPLHTVLIGTSLESNSDQVVRAGLDVARAAGARVFLVHAARVAAGLTEPDLGIERMKPYAIRCQELLVEQIARLGIGETELAGARIMTGNPPYVLIDAARMAGADLIVVGATGSGPFAAELLGSTADRVLRKASCPVLVVRGELRVPPRRVLAPVDLSPLSGDSFRCGLQLLSQLSKGEEIEVRAVFALSFLEMLARRRKAEDSPLHPVERQSAEELLRFIRENQTDPSFQVGAAVLPGEARSEILRELNENPFELVLLGTNGRGGLDRLVLGSVASTVARKAPCSVLMIPPDAALGEGIAEAVLNRTTPVWHREAASGESMPEP